MRLFPHLLLSLLIVLSVTVLLGEGRRMAQDLRADEEQMEDSIVKLRKAEMEKDGVPPIYWKKMKHQKPWSLSNVSYIYPIYKRREKKGILKFLIDLTHKGIVILLLMRYFLSLSSGSQILYPEFHNSSSKHERATPEIGNCESPIIPPQKLMGGWPYNPSMNLSSKIWKVVYTKMLSPISYN